MSEEDELEPVVIPVTPQILLGNTTPAKMPIKHLRQAQVKKIANVSGYIQRSTVVIARNGETYLKVGKRVNYDSSKTFRLYIQGNEEKGYTLWIPELFRGRWDPLLVASIDEVDMELVPVTKIIIGDPPSD